MCINPSYLSWHMYAWKSCFEISVLSLQKVFRNDKHICFDVLQTVFYCFHTCTGPTSMIWSFDKWRHFDWIASDLSNFARPKTLLFSSWQITLICLNRKQTKFISSSVHQTKLNFNLSIDFQAELDEVIIKFVHHPVSTDKLENWQGC